MPSNITIPAGSPPRGVVSNIVDPQYYGGCFVVINITFLSIALVMLVSRFYAQIMILKRVGLDDCK